MKGVPHARQFTALTARGSPLERITGWASWALSDSRVCWSETMNPVPVANLDSGHDGLRFGFSQGINLMEGD